MPIIQALQIAMFSLFIAVMVYISYRIGMNNWATGKLNVHKQFYATRMAVKGYRLYKLPASYSDTSPCDIRFAIESEDVRIHGASWDIYRLVNKIDSGKITESKLRSMSAWPYERIPS